MKKRSKKSSLVYVVIGLVIVAMLLPMIIRLLPNNMTTNKPPVDNTQTETPDDSGGGTTDEDHIHVYDKMNPVPIAHKSLATCTTPAVYYLSCSCGLVARDSALVFYMGDPLGHDFVNGKCTRCTAFNEGGGNSGGTTVDPETCSHAATKEAYVSRTVLDHNISVECGHEQHFKCVVCTLCEKVLSKDYSSSEDCTWYKGIDFDMICDVCGCVNGHTVALEYVVKEDGYHYRREASCTVCQEYFPRKADVCEYINGVCVYCKAADPDYTGVDTHEHAFVQQIRTGAGKLAKAATCYTPNSYYYSCICGEVGTETFYFGEPLAHIYVEGICQFCGVEQNHVHVYDQQNTDSKYAAGGVATCTTPAFYYYSCVCGEKGTYTFPYPTAIGLGHVEVKHAAQAANCESYGWYEYVTCSREGCDYTTYNTIPATGHTYVNGVCTTCQAVNPKYEQVDAFVDHQPVLNADQTAFEWSGNWTLGDLDANGNYREFNTVHRDYNDTAHKWLIYTPDVVDPYPGGFWSTSAGYRVTAPYQVGVARDYDMIIVWTAPEDGTVKIGATDFNIKSVDHSYNLRLYLNDTLVYPSEDYLNIGYGDAINTDEELVEALKDVIITVKAGDKLQFRCSRITQGMNTSFLPTVEYMCQHTYVTMVEHNFSGSVDYACHVETKTCSSCGDVVEGDIYGGIEAEQHSITSDESVEIYMKCPECGETGNYSLDHFHTYENGNCGCVTCGYVQSTSAHAKLEEGEICPDCGKEKE